MDISKTRKFIADTQSKEINKIKARFKNTIDSIIKDKDNIYNHITHNLTYNDIKLRQPKDEAILNQKQEIKNLFNEIKSSYSDTLDYIIITINNMSDNLKHRIVKISAIEAKENEDIDDEIIASIKNKFKEDSNYYITEAQQIIEDNLNCAIADLYKIEESYKCIEYSPSEINIAMHKMHDIIKILNKKQLDIVKSLKTHIDRILEECIYYYNNATEEQREKNYQALIQKLKQWIDLAEQEYTNQLSANQSLIDMQKINAQCIKNSIDQVKETYMAMLK